MFAGVVRELQVSDSCLTLKVHIRNGQYGKDETGALNFKCSHNSEVSEVVRYASFQ